MTPGSCVLPTGDSVSWCLAGRIARYLEPAGEYHRGKDSLPPSGYGLPRQALPPLCVASQRSKSFCRICRLGQRFRLDPTLHHPYWHNRYRQTWFDSPPPAIGSIAAASRCHIRTYARAQAAAKKRDDGAAASSRSRIRGIIGRIKEDNGRKEYENGQQRLMGQPRKALCKASAMQQCKLSAKK